MRCRKYDILKTLQGKFPQGLDVLGVEKLGVKPKSIDQAILSIDYEVVLGEIDYKYHRFYRKI